MSCDTDRRHRFETVAAETYEPLQRYLRRRAQPADAADVFGDTLLAVWRRIDDVPHDDPLPWCYGVARRCLANHRRGAERHLRLAERIGNLDPPPFTADPPSEPIDPELEEAIDSLTESEREIVRLWAWEQLEPRQIADVLGLTSNAVSVALARVKRKLREQLGDRQHRGDAGQEFDGSTSDHQDHQDHHDHQERSGQ